MKKILIFCLLLSLLVFATAVMAQQAPAPAPAPAKAAPATAAPAAPAAAAGAPAKFTIARMDLASGVEKRQPTGIATTFPSTTEKVYCFLELNNVTANESFTYVWSFGLNEMARVTQTATKTVAKYRTWSTKALGGMKGDWKVEIVDASGKVLKSAPFKVE
jgi:ABC-type Fe3+-hydroxamate transport system substrate-binding protein